MHANWQRGVALFNAGDFFDAHEAFEEVWRETPRATDRRRHLQGLVQLAVAFHHQARGNKDGAGSVLERSMRNLDGAEASFPELDLHSLRDCLWAWREYLDDSDVPPERLSLPPLSQLVLRLRV